MKQFWAQYIKDLYHHFSYLNAYIILGCYCILSYAAAIYIGEYFLKETEPMNAYFSLQPLILMLIIPAITMGTWSEEFKSGTSELLLTLPISYVKLVLAKFFASLTFVLFLLCSSVPLLLITNALSVPDYGNICLGYIALLFCCSFFIAIGCLISSLNKNNIISYLLTIVVIFFVIQIKFSGIALGNMTFSLQGLLFQENYNVLLSGIFYWSNLCYFIIGTILSLWLNNVVITYYNPFKSNKKKYFRWFLALLIMIFISSTLGIRYMLYTPIDMTENKKFTLFSKSQEALRKLNDLSNIEIKMYDNKIGIIPL